MASVWPRTGLVTLTYTLQVRWTKNPSATESGQKGHPIVDNPRFPLRLNDGFSMAKILLLQTGQVPTVAGRPFTLTGLGSGISLLALHPMQ